MKTSVAEQLLLDALKNVGLHPETEHQFSEDRKWRFDFAWPEIKLAIEVDGSGFHTSDKGKRLDQQKRNAALELGWRVLAYPAREVGVAKRRIRIVEQIMRVVCGVECPQSASVVLVGD